MSASSATALVRTSARRKVSALSSELTPEILKLRNGWKPGRPAPAALREHALQLVASGIKPGEVARVVGVSYESIRLWKNAAGVTVANAEAKVTPPPPSTGASADVRSDEQVDLDLPEGVAPSPTMEPAGVVPRLRDTAHGLSMTEQAGILELKQRHPSMGPAQIRIQLKRFNGWRLSVRAIARLLKQKGYQLVHVSCTPKGQTIQRFEAPHRNAIWQMDFVELRVGPERVSLLLVIDDFSRFCVAHALLTEPTSEAVVELVKKAIHQHGKPESVYTDRGSQFLAWRGASSLENFLETELIDHHVGTSYHPQGRGKVESLAGTIQRELWQVVHFASVEEARSRTATFFQWYNEKRAHMGIDGLTPADRYFGRWEAVKAQVEAVSRGRQLVLAGTGTDRFTEEVHADGGPAEVLRLVCIEGRLELRFLGHRVNLGPIEA